MTRTSQPNAVTLLLLKGLPASGKTTYAQALVTRGNWKRVNKDELRKMLDNGKWTAKNEQLVIMLRDAIICEALTAGYNVVVDDTNLNPIHATQLQDYAQRMMMLNSGLDISFQIESVFLEVSPEECIKRDLKRPDSVGSKVIMQMYNKYLKPPADVYEHVEGLPHAVIVDVDGTIAHGIGVTRKPHEYDKVSTDTLDKTIKAIIVRYPGHVIFMSGRPESCRVDTEMWLFKNGIPYTSLFMRSMEHYKNQTKDYIVKHELFDQHIRGVYNIDFVLDDRNQVVNEWRSMGLKVLQVAEGDF